MTNQQNEDLARSRAVAKYRFYKHLAVFVAVNLLLLIINLVTSPGSMWSIWPLIGWGIAIVFHALNVFVFTSRNGVLDRMTEEELRKQKEGRH